MSKMHLLSIAVVSMLAGCGGGGEPVAAVPTPQAVTGALRARALAVALATPVSPAEAARQLMDFGERTFSQYFPGHKPTQTYLEYLYRYYPETGIYLGVANGNVYVMGGEFGNAPLLVGPLTNYITPVSPDTGPGPSGPNNGCYDLALFDTAGTRTIANYVLSGAAAGSMLMDTLVGDLKTFEGNQARESETKLTTNTGGPVFDTQVKNYSRRTGDAEVTEYGDVGTTNTGFEGYNFKITSTTVWTPPFVDKQYALAIGESYTYTQNSTVTTVQDSIVPGVPGTTTTNQTTVTTTIKYVGRESVSVPAGTYNACKFESTIAGSPALTTSWAIVGKGIAAKSVTVDGASTSIMEATSITINGQRI